MFSTKVQSLHTHNKKILNEFWHDEQEHEVIKQMTKSEFMKRERHAMAVNAEEDEKYRRQDPQDNSKFEEENFFKFKVIQEDQEIRLHTYRTHAKSRKENPRAVLVFMHGINGHSGLCAHLAEKFAEYQFTSVAFDQRGYGKSEGLPAFIDDINTTVTDMEIFITIIKEQIYSPSTPVFVLGYSLGGLYTYLLGLKNPTIARSFLMFCPSIKENLFFQPLGQLVAEYLSKVAPKWVTPVKSGRSNASQNPTVNQNIYRDQLIYNGGLRAGTIYNVIVATREAAETFEDFHASFLIISGGLDQICDPDVSFQLYEKSPSVDKQFLFYEDMWHDAWHEEEIFDYLPRVTQFILDRS